MLQFRYRLEICFGFFFLFKKQPLIGLSRFFFRFRINASLTPFRMATLCQYKFQRKHGSLQQQHLQQVQSIMKSVTCPCGGYHAKGPLTHPDVMPYCVRVYYCLQHSHTHTHTLMLRGDLLLPFNRGGGMIPIATGDADSPSAAARLGGQMDWIAPFRRWRFAHCYDASICCPMCRFGLPTHWLVFAMRTESFLVRAGRRTQIIHSITACVHNVGSWDKEREKIKKTAQDT